jgi:hypothetical protein
VAKGWKNWVSGAKVSTVSLDAGSRDRWPSPETKKRSLPTNATDSASGSMISAPDRSRTTGGGSGVIFSG